MKEIGGYFGLDEFSGTPYYSDLVAVNSGRNALLYILRARKVKKLFIPDYLCDSVSKMCEREHIDYDRYRVSHDFMPEYDQPLHEGEYIYIVNYYGQITEDKAIRLQHRYQNMILDNVQAFFQKPVQGMDTVYSCRKFFGVPDGGYAATNAKIQEKLLIDKSQDRMKHLFGRFEQTASEFYSDFIHNEELFYDRKLKSMSRITQNILKAVDYDRIKQKREDNFAFLESQLGAANTVKLSAPVGPYAYPYYCTDAPALRKKMAENGIYIATLWPEAIEFGGVAKEYSRNILPLPCDQRYGIEDMNYLVEELIKCLRI